MAVSGDIKYKDLKLVRAGIGGFDQEYTLTFQLRLDGSYALPEIVDWLADELPTNLDAWGNDLCILQNFTLEAPDEHNNTIWNGEARYKQHSSSLAIGGNQGEKNTYVSFDTATYEIVVWKAKDGNGKEVAVVNSAGDYFENPLTEIETRLIIRIEKSYSYSSMSTTTLMSYMNSVNSSPIRIASTPIHKRGGWMRNIKFSVRLQSKTSKYWRVTFEIEVRPPGKTYDRKVLDAGYYYLEAAGEDEDGKNIITRNGSKYKRVKANTYNSDTGEVDTMSSVVLLDGNGGLLKDTTPGNEKYLTFRTKTEKSWRSLGLPRTISEVITEMWTG